MSGKLGGILLAVAVVLFIAGLVPLAIIIGIVGGCYLLCCKCNM